MMRGRDTWEGCAGVNAGNAQMHGRDARDAREVRFNFKAAHDPAHPAHGCAFFSVLHTILLQVV